MKPIPQPSNAETTALVMASTESGDGDYGHGREKIKWDERLKAKSQKVFVVRHKHKHFQPFLVVDGALPSFLKGVNCRIILSAPKKHRRASWYIMEHFKGGLEWYVAGFTEGKDAHFILVNWPVPKMIDSYQRSPYKRIRARLIA